MKVMNETGCQWWGYIHTNNSLHAKRYFDKRDIEEAEESPFVKQAYGPIEGTREDMIAILKENQ